MTICVVKIIVAIEVGHDNYAINQEGKTEGIEIG